MFKRIKNFDGVNRLDQLKKIREELDEFTVEVVNNNDAGIRLEGADLIQSVVTLWVNRGYKIEDIEDNFKKLYIKESKRGRKVTHIDGEGYHDKLVADLLDTIALKDRQIERMIEGIKDGNK